MKTTDEIQGSVRRFVISLMVLVGFLVLSTIDAQAYTYSTCGGNKIRWNSGWTNMYISTTSYPAGSVWDQRLQNAMWHWNNVKGSGFNFYVGRDTDGTHSSSNGKNEIYIADDMDPDALAVTTLRMECWWWWFFGKHYVYGIKEADIGFDSRDSWSPWSYSYSNPGGSPYNFEGVALHELGHALGLDHEDGRQATMNSYYPNGGPLGYYKEWDSFADDRQGVRFLYPDGTTETDLAASPLKRTGAGTSGLVTSPSSARAGSWVNLEFTFSNLSTASKTFDIGFYLSTDSYIHTSDTLLGTNSGAWASAGGTGTYPRWLWIPSWVTPGNYYLGFLLDPNRNVAESNEGNNRQPMPRQIQITN